MTDTASSGMVGGTPNDLTGGTSGGLFGGAGR
jgi:hypothetical protein